MIVSDSSCVICADELSTSIFDMSNIIINNSHTVIGNGYTIHTSQGTDASNASVENIIYNMTDDSGIQICITEKITSFQN